MNDGDEFEKIGYLSFRVNYKRNLFTYKTILY